MSAHRTYLKPLFLGMLLTTTTALAIPPPGVPVDRIEFADRIDNWTPIDDHRLLVSLGPQSNYLLTLQGSCHRLSFAGHIGVTTSNNVIWAGFDRVTADGFHCSIESINQLSNEETAALKS